MTEKKATKCQHRHLRFVSVTEKEIKEGWEKFSEKEAADLEDYPTLSENYYVFCEDCGQTLEENED